MTDGEPVAKTGLAPKWLAAALRASGLGGPQIAALLDRAPLEYFRVKRPQGRPGGRCAARNG